MNASPAEFVERWTEKPARATLRSRARDAALGALRMGDAIARALGRPDPLATPRTHVVLLHHVFEDERPGFEMVLDTLGEHHRFVSYPEAVRRILADDHPEPAIAITFDDGLLSCAHAGRVLTERGISACFFICPSIIGQKDPDVLRAFCRDRLHTGPYRFLDWDQLAALRDAGHEIASHTDTHPEIGAIHPDELASELVRSREVLEARIGPVRHFAWPFGQWRHCSPDAARAVFDAGFESCASGQRGCHLPGAGPREPRRACIRRDLVVAGWTVDRNLTYLRRSVRASSKDPARTADWPDGWVDRITEPSA